MAETNNNNQTPLRSPVPSDAQNAETANVEEPVRLRDRPPPSGAKPAAAPKKPQPTAKKTAGKKPGASPKAKRPAGKPKRKVSTSKPAPPKPKRPLPKAADPKPIKPSAPQPVALGEEDTMDMEEQVAKRPAKEYAIAAVLSVGAAVLIIVMLSIIFTIFLWPKNEILAYEDFQYLDSNTTDPAIEARAEKLQYSKIQFYSTLNPGGYLIEQATFTQPMVLLYVDNESGKTELNIAFYDGATLQRDPGSSIVEINDIVTGETLTNEVSGCTTGLFYFLAARNIEVDIDKDNDTMRVGLDNIRNDLKRATQEGYAMVESASGQPA